MLPILFMLQAELSIKESQVNDLRANIETQQSETSKAKSELKTTLENIEQLKQNFSTDKTGWETEKAALLKRAEDAEAALKLATDELSGLRHQINSMTPAIFGKQQKILPFTQIIYHNHLHVYQEFY